ncbi:Rieske (2Fe-2S) protein [Acidocella sp.]|uniref:Rieske (2Fe-2S) protein n=1 Tax=Acidocella sp. TaxID=50710 RepID=UPI002602F845|nr:Rieske (2Fe-2S) protein [Acidocella sp.]MDD2795878.1 Rieske (2Fe-2S) protein [Acidocella sp.]MDD2795936.1 Rieske (2Fe-2S) protein [Acidocella sp.]
MSQIEAAKSGEVSEGALHAIKVAGHSIALTRVGGKVQAFVNKCPHLGMPLTKGKIEGGAVTCPFHGSKFDICSGRNVDWVKNFLGMPLPGWAQSALAMGKQPAGLKTLAATEKDGAIFLEV